MADVNTTGNIKFEGDASGAVQASGKVEKSLDNLEGAAKNAASGINSKLTGAVENASGKFSALGTIGVGALLKIGMGAVDLAGKLAANLVKPIEGTIKLAGDFEGKMNSFSAAAGDSLEGTGLSVEQFRKQFLQLGKDLPVSTMEVADAATAMVKGGIDPATVAAGGLESTLKFAAAAGMGLEEAANASVSQLAVFTKATDTAADKSAFLAKAQELLVKAAGASKADVAGMSDAILMSAGTAKSAGVDYEDYVTSLTMVTDAMPSAAEAGTSFKNMLSSLSPTSKKAIEAFDDLGLSSFNTKDALAALASAGIKPISSDANVLEGQLQDLAKANHMTANETSKFMQSFNSSAFYDAEGKFVGMRKAADLLKGAFQGLTEQQRIQYAQAIFGNDGMGAANVLIDGGTEAYDKYTVAIKKANGVNAQSEATQKGLNFMLDQFNGSMEALGITIGTAFLPLATKVISAGTDMLNGIEPLFNYLTNDSAIGFQEFYNAMDSAFGPTAATKITDFVKDAKGLIEGLQAWLSGDPLGADKFGAALTQMFGEDAAIKIGEFASGLKTTIEDVVSWVQTNWPLIQATISGVINGIVSFVQTNWPIFQTTVEGVVNSVSGFVNNTLVPAIQSVQPVFQQIVTWVQTNWPNIQQIVSDVINAVAFVFNNILIPLAAVVIAAIGSIVKFIVENWPVIRQVIAFVVNAVVTKFEEFKQQIALAFDQAANAVRWMKEFTGAISKGWENVKKEVTEAWGRIETWFNTLPQVLNTIGVNIMLGLIEGIKAQADAVFQVISGVVTNAIDGVKKILNIHSPSKEFEEIGSLTMEGMKIGIEKTGDSVIGSLLTFVNKAVTLANQAASVTGSTAHVSPDATNTLSAAALGQAEGMISSGSAYVDAAQASNHGDTSVPAGLARDDWDTHDRPGAPQPATIQVDGVALASVLIGRMGTVLQQDARRYGG